MSSGAAVRNIPAGESDDHGRGLSAVGAMAGSTRQQNQNPIIVRLRPVAQSPPRSLGLHHVVEAAVADQTAGRNRQKIGVRPITIQQILEQPEITLDRLALPSPPSRIVDGLLLVAQFRDQPHVDVRDPVVVLSPAAERFHQVAGVVCAEIPDVVGIGPVQAQLAEGPLL